MDTIESTLAKHSRKIKNLQQKSLGHETRIQSTLQQIQENETQYKSKFEDFINELQGASQFMSSLQIQNTTLSNKVRENEEQIREMVNTTETLRHLPQEVEYQKERLESFVQANESEDKGHVLKMDEVMQEHTSNIQQLNTKYEHLLNLIHTNETKISQIQTCNATETLSHIKQKLTKHEEDLERIEINHKEMSDTIRKKMDDINAKIQAHSETTSNLQVNFESLQSQLNNLKDDFKHTDSLTESLKTNMTEIKDQLSNYKSDSQILNLESSFFEVTSELYKELDVVKNKMSTVESQVLNLSGGYAELLKISSQDVTVACRLWIRNSEEIHLNKDTIVTCFNGHDLNIGKCYNKTTGIFTAPCKGLYLCSLMMGSEDWARFNIHVRKNGQQVQENETQNDSKFEELIKELQAASEFLTNLQNQNKKLSEKVQENNEQMRELLSITETYGHLPQELANQKERLESFQQVNESEYKGLVIKMEELMQGHLATSNQLNTKHEHLLNLVEANKTELSQLKTCISDDALSNNTQMCTDRDEHVKRIERKLRETSDRNRKKNVNLNSKIQANKETTSRLQVKFKSLQKKVTGNFNTTKLLIRLLKSGISEIADQFSTYKSHTQELELMKSKMTTAEGEVDKPSLDCFLSSEIET
uniref:C1q domain-containing protein n=1 Tax=Biomphalaria glabrata TaxID=6526 RepID=A0A2C9KW40_BIOGL